MPVFRIIHSESKGLVMSKNGKPRRKGLRWTILGLVVVLVVCTAVAASTAFRTSNEIDSSKIAEVERGDVARSVVATGKIEPLAKVEVKSKASGIVKRVVVEYGDVVKKGQILVELDKDELEAQVREARATLQAAEAAEQSMLAAIERTKVDAEGPDLPFLKTAVERQEKLLAQGVIPKSNLDEAQRIYEMALNKQQASQRAVVVSRADAARAHAQVAEAQASLERAQQNLLYSTIVSPMDGLVLSRDVEVGDAVSSILVMGSQATLVATLGDMSDVYVKGKVDEADVSKVFLGQRARTVVESLKDKPFDGAVSKIAPLGVEKDNVTTFEVRVSIANQSGELKANMSANAEIILEEKKNVLRIPESAVIYDKERNASVEVPDTASETGKRKVAIKVGLSNGVKTEVLEGLEEGQKVILQ
jgi:HlyD family secretion protein